MQVDGEPWVQSPGDVVVLKSALKVSCSRFFQFSCLLAFYSALLFLIITTKSLTTCFRESSFYVLIHDELETITIPSTPM